MKGILERGNHRFATVDSVVEAWKFIRQNVKVDLVIVELRLKEGDGLAFIQRLKNDCYLKSLPVLVYAAKGDRESVKNVLAMRVQNFLLKPYRDEIVFAEIAKAEKGAWRQRQFENEEACCDRMGHSPERLRALLNKLRHVLEEIKTPFAEWIESEATPPLENALKKLAVMANGTGAFELKACLEMISEKALAAEWSDLKEGPELLGFSAELIRHHLKPSLMPDGFLTNEELSKEEEAQARALWANAAKENRCPVVGWSQLKREIEKLTSCPVIDSIGASFQMAANGHSTSLSPLLDIIRKDPSLTAQILIDSNRIKRSKGSEDSSEVEKTQTAVGLLGELRLAALGGSLSTMEESLMAGSPPCSWPQFRMFQLGTARLAQFTCNYLEMPDLETTAYTAGLVHDLGKLLLVRLHPFALQAIQDYAKQQEIRLAAAEKFFLETTTREMAIHFAEKQGLPKRFVNVMRWMDKPEDATEDAELVAVVSLARDLCRHNKVGFNGDTPLDDATPLAQTPEWNILRGRVFLNFDLRKFEIQARQECLHIKRELQGQLAK